MLCESESVVGGSESVVYWCESVVDWCGRVKVLVRGCESRV